MEARNIDGQTVTVGPRADLRGANLRGADLYGANLRGADLRGANLRGANLLGADLLEADLRGANLLEADLRGADLLEADLRGADLRGADLLEADLRGANLLEADLRGANLRGANLRGADLLEADLRGANLLEAGGLASPAPRKVETLGGRCLRSDGYEFLIFRMETGDPVIRAGCRTFTPKEFRAHVARQYPGSDKAKETLRIIAFLVAQAKQKPW